MLFRKCAGGVVFWRDNIYLLKNDKDEWVLPKGVIRKGMASRDVALTRVQEETGVNAEIIAPAGETCYEFYSTTRKKPVCNEVTWFLMRANDDESQFNKLLGFKDGAYFPNEEAAEKATYSQDKALVRLAYKQYQKLNV